MPAKIQRVDVSSRREGRNDRQKHLPASGDAVKQHEGTSRGRSFGVVDGYFPCAEKVLMEHTGLLSSLSFHKLFQVLQRVLDNLFPDGLHKQAVENGTEERNR